MLEAETGQYLLREQVAKAFQADTDVIRQCLAAQSGFPVEARKED